MLEEALPVAKMVGGMKVTEGDTVEECERNVSVAATEAETLGQAVWETVGDRERAVSVAAGEAVPALELAVPRALAVPPPDELSRALGEARAVARGVKVAVVDCERRVNVACTVAERVAVEDCECAVTVAAAVADPGTGLPVRCVLPVGLPEAEGRPEVLPEARAEGVGTTRFGTLPEAVGESVPEALQEEGKMVPLEEQAAGQGQGRKAESPAEGQ